MTKYHLQNTKYTIGICVILLFSFLLLLLPDLIGLHISLQLRLVALVLLCVYIVLSFEALFGAMVVVVIAIAVGDFQTNNGFEQILGYIDSNTIGLLLGMMVIVAIMSNTGIFQFVGIKAIKSLERESLEVNDLTLRFYWNHIDVHRQCDYGPFDGTCNYLCVQIDQAISHPLRNRDGARIQCRRSSNFDRRSPLIS
ncbi:MAG: SLC13 family permease [Nitrososphaeraceae archaeon]